MTGGLAAGRRVAAGSAAAMALALGSITGPGVVDAVAFELEPPPQSPFQEAPASWPTVEVDAEAYVLVEASTGQVLASQRADEPRAVASTVKVLTALTAIERAELDDEVTVGDEVVDVPGAGVELEPGDTWTVEELLEALIARSGNDAAEALAVHVAGTPEEFIALMREDAATLGLGSLSLVSASGLDDDNQLSAMDLTTIARAALARSDLRPILARDEVDLPSVGTVETRNQLLLDYPDATGVKTGFTIAAGNSVVGSAVRDGRELVVVVLGSGDDPARFDAAAQLLDLGFDEYRPTSAEGRAVYAVAGGEVAVDAAPVELTVPTDRTPEIGFPVPVRVPDADLEVPIEVDAEIVGTVTATLDTGGMPDQAAGAAGLGRAVVDGVYAALRAATEHQELR